MPMIAILYTFGLVFVGAYGARSALHGWLWWRWERDQRTRAQSPAPMAPPSLPAARSERTAAGEAPIVTVQLPIYNERAVAARAIAAACRLRWPKDRLEIQVLDDSTDDTRAIVDAAARAGRRDGIDVQVLRRDHRTGFKGGALAAGTAAARGELLAILDADFVPPSDLLETLTRALAADPGLGCVQARWAHLNEDERALTRAQALALDAYFVIEQTARAAFGLCLNFNGSGGLWRREAIAAAGGWRGDTLTEDVDLSYRAQLAGWRIAFLPRQGVPGELPATMLAFKRQQTRWARGTVQCLRRLSPRIVRARDWSTGRKLHALLCLSNHFVQPILLLLLLGTPLLLWLRPTLHPMLLLLTLLSLGQPGMIAAAQRWLHGPAWPARFLAFPVLAVLGAGMTVNGSMGVWLGLTGGPGTFERTPKRGEGARTPMVPATLGQASLELALALWALLGLTMALSLRAWGSVPFLLIYATGLAWVGGLSLWEGRQPRLREEPARHTREGAERASETA
jgi:membrane glycosyltransferase